MTTSAPEPVTCAAPGCDQTVPRPNRPGRPAIYCSADCRPTRAHAAVRRTDVVVEVDHPATSPDGRPTERVWTVRLRRGKRIVVIVNDLGWPTANALAHDLNDLLLANPPHKGAAID